MVTPATKRHVCVVVWALLVFVVTQEVRGQETSAPPQEKSQATSEKISESTEKEKPAVPLRPRGEPCVRAENGAPCDERPLSLSAGNQAFIRPVPEKKKNRVADWKFWLGVSLLAGATIADAESTKRGLDRCPGCSEGNPLFGRRPGRARLYLQGGAMTAAGVVVSYYIKKRSTERGEGNQALWMIPIGLETGLHTWATIHNMRIQPHQNSNSTCPALGAGCLQSPLPNR